MFSLVNQKYGTLTVIEELGNTSGVGFLYRFRCDCGKEQVWYMHEVRGNGKVKICRHCETRKLQTPKAPRRGSMKTDCSSSPLK